MYAPVPPAPLAVAVPVDCPKHNTFVTAAAGTVTVTAAGAVMVVVDVAVQPRLSVTVTVYVPAPSPFKLWVVAVAPVDHKKVYVAVPPPTFAVTLPLVDPKQLICDPLLLLVTAAVTVTALAGWVIVTQATLRQLFASLTVTQCCPAANPVLVAVVVPFAQRKVYGAVPPEPATVADPVDCPKQFTFTTVPELMVAVTALGCVKVTFAVAIQPFASVVVTR